MTEQQPKELKLKFPFKDQKGELIETITLQPPKGKHLRGMDAELNFGMLLTLGEKLSGFIPRTFDEMSAVDCTAVAEAVMLFLDDTPGQ